MQPNSITYKVQRGDITTTYTYDLCNNCLSITHSEGKTTRQTFDGLGRMTQKELPDGAFLTYTYDPDSHLTVLTLPNGVTWRVSYDSMGRKIQEELQAGASTSQHWEYTYENGRLQYIVATGHSGRIDAIALSQYLLK